MSLLIIRADLVHPPTTPQSFRTVTLWSKVEYSHDICVEVADDEKDSYYFWMKKKGLLDFVSDLIIFGEENGLRIDCKKRSTVYPTILVDRIVPENTWFILNSLRNL